MSCEHTELRTQLVYDILTDKESNLVHRVVRLELFCKHCFMPMKFVFPKAKTRIGTVDEHGLVLQIPITTI